MNRLLEDRLKRLSGALPPGLLRSGLKGIEKESLRVGPDGTIARTPHPRALGSALRHPHITTDYSEALLELITPPCADCTASLDYLARLHQFVYRNIEANELLWGASMPCVVGGEESIPMARYGTSNRGVMKHVYRRGLAYRYGKLMQIIAGVHFNYSLPLEFWPVYRELEEDRRPLREFTDDAYFRMIRNLQRFGWLVAYLFGASPAICKSFLPENTRGFAEFDRDTWYEPWATSLRMSDIGYRNKSPTDVVIRYDDLHMYVAGLTRAIETPYPAYEKIGVKVDGEYRQLNANYLQIENEYYSSVRPKQIPDTLEKPTLALERRGVRYVELRSVDLNPFEPLGVQVDQMRFLETFLLLCLLSGSPRIDDEERRRIDYNQGIASHRGRAPGLKLRDTGEDRPLQDWAVELIEDMRGICDLLDAGDPERPYVRALDLQREAARDSETTPSARVLAAMRAQGTGFFTFARRLSEQHREWFLSRPLAREDLEAFEEMAGTSLREQAELEASDDVSFDEFLRRYFAQRLEAQT